MLSNNWTIDTQSKKEIKMEMESDVTGLDYTETKFLAISSSLKFS